MPDALYEKRDHYAVFTFNRPERLNAQTAEMRRLFGEAIEDFNADPEMRVGIVTGEGRAFSSGRDLKDVASREGGFAGGEWPGVTRTGDPYPFSRSPKPFIAAINGLAVAGGLAVALDCDIRICTEEAYFGLMEPKRGIMAGYAVNHLPHIIGVGAATHMLLTGGRVSAQRALEWQLVTEVVVADRLMPRAIELAEEIGEGAPLATQGTKQVVRQWRMAMLDDSIDLYASVNEGVINSADAKEGPRAFAEKRSPEWTGR